MIHVLVAFKKEIDSFLDILARVEKKRVSGFVTYSGFLQGEEVRVIKTGIGQRNLDCSLLNGCSMIVSSGFCGALVPDVRAGDVVVMTEVLLAEKAAQAEKSSSPWRRLFGERATPIGGGWAEESPAHRWIDEDSIQRSRSGELLWPDIQKCLQAVDLQVHAGRTVTVPKVIKSYHHKAELHNVSQAISVDMEDYYRMEWAQNVRLPFLSIRVVLDELTDELPSLAGIGNPLDRSPMRASLKVASFLKNLSIAQEHVALLLETLIPKKLSKNLK